MHCAVNYTTNTSTVNIAVSCSLAINEINSKNDTLRKHLGCPECMAYISASRNGSWVFVVRTDEERILERLRSRGKNSWSQRWKCLFSQLFQK
jgi:L-2-hydroxyglutarate oxidase LhgO